MIINFQKIKNLAVETESEIYLGKITDLEIDIDAHTVKKYFVENKKFFITDSSFLISPEQIVKITNEKIVVQDNVQKQEITLLQKQALPKKEAVSLNSEIKTETGN